MATESLALTLAENGLIQFGRFVQPDGAVWPVAVHLRWLPSYPDVLRAVTAALAPLVASADRILTTADATPIGIALSLQTGLPAVYATGEIRDYTAAFAIEGAYDVGHPTLLLTDVLADATQARPIAALAGRVGLEVQTVLTVLDLGLGAAQELQSSGCRVRSLLALPDILPALSEAGWLPDVMRLAVMKWITDPGVTGAL